MGCCTVAPVGGYVPLSQFVPYIRPYVLKAPDDIMQHFVRVAAIEFCRDVKVLKRRVHIDSVANVSDYVIDIEDDYRVVAVNKVSEPESGELPLMTTLPTTPYQWAPRGHYFSPPRDLYLFPTPNHDCDDYYEVELFVQPGQDTCNLDLVLYDSFAEQISFGAMARLLLVKEGEWYDPRQALYYETKFSRAKGAAKTMASRNYSTAPLIAKARRWV
jgi:hypothetical protein